METNETNKKKCSKIVLKEKKDYKKEESKQKAKKREKTYSNEKKPYLKKNERFVFFLQISSSHPNKQKYES